MDLTELFLAWHLGELFSGDPIRRCMADFYISPGVAVKDSLSNEGFCLCLPW